jgi:glucose/arabinose dehydrogenase
MAFKWLKGGLLVVASIALAACGSAAAARQAAAPAAPTGAPSMAPAATPAPSSEPAPTPAPTPAATPEPVAAAPAPPAPPPPATMTVRFNQLPAGSHPIHLHSICSGTQNFHLATIGAIAPDAAGGASVTLSTNDFGRGWCLIVYTDASLTRVLNYRPI